MPTGADQNLSINKYKQTEYKPLEYPPTGEIMAELRGLEKKIGEEMDDLERLLGMQSDEPERSTSRNYFHEPLQERRFTETG